MLTDKKAALSNMKSNITCICDGHLLCPSNRINGRGHGAGVSQLK